MKQMDLFDYAYYGYNACNITIEIFFIRLDICTDRDIYIHTYTRSQKKIIDSKQLCTMCVHISIFRYIYRYVYKEHILVYHRHNHL